MFAVLALDIVREARKIDSNCKEQKPARIRWWALKFQRRSHVMLRTAKLVSQHMQEEAEHVRQSFANTKMVLIRMNDISKHLLVSIAGASVYFNSHHSYAGY